MAQEDQCYLCRGTGEVELALHAYSEATVGCPACMERDKDAIADELRRLLSEGAEACMKRDNQIDALQTEIQELQQNLKGKKP